MTIYIQYVTTPSINNYSFAFDGDTKYRPKFSQPWLLSPSSLIDPPESGIVRSDILDAMWFFFTYTYRTASMETLRISSQLTWASFWTLCNLHRQWPVKSCGSMAHYNNSINMYGAPYMIKLNTVFVTNRHELSCWTSSAKRLWPPSSQCPWYPWPPWCSSVYKHCTYN